MASILLETSSHLRMITRLTGNYTFPICLDHVSLCRQKIQIDWNLYISYQTSSQSHEPENDHL